MKSQCTELAETDLLSFFDSGEVLVWHRPPGRCAFWRACTRACRHSRPGYATSTYSQPRIGRAPTMKRRSLAGVAALAVVLLFIVTVYYVGRSRSVQELRSEPAPSRGTLRYEVMKAKERG